MTPYTLYACLHHAPVTLCSKQHACAANYAWQSNVKHHVTSCYDGRQCTQVCEKRSTAVQRLCLTGMCLFFDLLCPGKGVAQQPSRL